MKSFHLNRLAYTLVEVMAVVGVLGVLAAIIIPRVTTSGDLAESKACDVLQGDIELQVELWRHNTGTMPAANLSDIGAETLYFPEGLPMCPADGTSYTIDTSTGLVIGHTH